MFCCGGADEEPAGPPANQYSSAPPNKAGNPNFGGGNRGEPRNTNAPRSGGPAKVLPIEIPAVALDELNRMTGNFGNKALIGEGSYGRVFQGKYNGVDVAIKKLDASSSEEPDSDFTSQQTTAFSSTSSQPKVLYTMYYTATPRLSEDKVKQCIDPKLNNDFPPKAVAKLAAVAALCVQYEADFRPNMTIVVKALQPLLNSKPAGPESTS
ncbi:hypothetical protein Bca52824_029220 [Brassica carinata]|uniref:Uncharacterized protein n=1 Tax=Brassica carinata TaxID=52824 RepID=A0A8X8ARA8_BRACI|nr:hypothetical protein Bca52824_029220 [Brassica carinata]